MPRYLRWIWLAMALFSVAGILAVWSMPKDWRVERSIEVAVPPDVVFELLVDLERWPLWSPWQESDYEGLEFVYEGPKRGVGAAYHWDSETTGDGRVEIVEASAPERLVFTLAFQSGKIRTRETLTLEPASASGAVATRVRWVDEGEMLQTLLGRLSIPVIEESMGRDLDTGLQRLQAAASSATEAAPDPTPSGS